MMADLFDPPPPVDTRRASFEAIRPKADVLQGRILRYMQRLHASNGPGITPDECASYLGLDKLSVRPRFTELQRAGLIHDTGARRKNPTSGKSAKVWTLTELGAAQ